MRGAASETVAILGDASSLDASIDAAFEPIAEPDPESEAAAALFAEDDMADGPAIPLRSDDSANDLDDLFADLVKEE
jgi:hypothetical protein